MIADDIDGKQKKKQIFYIYKKRCSQPFTARRRNNVPVLDLYLSVFLSSMLLSCKSGNAVSRHHLPTHPSLSAQ
jgi:hypothetical protein